MRYSTRPRSADLALSGSLPRGVKWLLIANVGIFLINFVAAMAGADGLFRPFRLVPYDVVFRFEIWQPVTYMFLHSVGDLRHILFNMLMLWMFGTPLEQTWGTRQFLRYYFLCGIGAGLCAILVNALFGQWYAATIGASGALFGLLLAFGVLFAETTVMFSFLFPIKAKYMVMIMGAIEFIYVCTGINSGISNIAHLGGMLFGLVYLKGPRLSLSASPFASLQHRYEEWKRQRARRKFQVYLRKQDGDRDRWVQ